MFQPIAYFLELIVMQILRLPYEKKAKSNRIAVARKTELEKFLLAHMGVGMVLAADLRLYFAPRLCRLPVAVLDCLAGSRDLRDGSFPFLARPCGFGTKLVPHPRIEGRA